jgi:hypothetical protein
MNRFYYFCKHVNGGSRYGGGLHCFRLPEDDHRINEFTKQYSSSGVYIYQTYPYTPSKKEEIFQIQMRLQAWSNDVTIEDPAPGGGRLA